MAENMKKREARIQKAGGVIGGVIGIASIVFAMAVVVFSGVSVKLTGTALELSGGIGDRASIPYTEITGVEWRDVFGARSNVNVDARLVGLGVDDDVGGVGPPVQPPVLPDVVGPHRGLFQVRDLLEELPVHVVHFIAPSFI